MPKTFPSETWPRLGFPFRLLLRFNTAEILLQIRLLLPRHKFSCWGDSFGSFQMRADRSLNALHCNPSLQWWFRGVQGYIVVSRSRGRLYGAIGTQMEYED